ncbi:hypothetical protein [Nostoc sp.]
MKLYNLNLVQLKEFWILDFGLSCGTLRERLRSVERFWILDWAVAASDA